MPPSVLKSVSNLDLDLKRWEQNPRIGKLLTETVLSGGKRIRPLITFLMADFFGISHQQIAPYGKTVELVHASTLAHDDVIDNATHRRGEPAINIVSSNKKAVLAGDFLLAYSVDLISRLGRNDIVIELSAMIKDLAEGEWVQLENAIKKDLSREDVLKVSLCKTASVMKWCCLIPGMLKNVDEASLTKIEDIGIAIGLAFQMTDDILDFKRNDPSKLADVKNKVINSVIFEALSDYYGPSNSVDMNKLESIDLSVLNIEIAIEKVRAMIAEYLNSAKKNLKSLSDGSENIYQDTHINAYQGMISLIDYLDIRI